jgi:acetyltransferase
MSSPRLSTPGRFRPEALFRPGSVAVIGAFTPEGGQIMGNLLAAGFNGAVLPVGGGQRAVAGVLAYPSIASLPIVPDLAVICPGQTDVAEALAELGRRGNQAAVVVGMASGLKALARATGVRSLGPGSFGIAVPGIGLNATLAHLRPHAGRVALVSQSAALCRAVLDWAGPNGVGFSHIVGIGGNDDIGFGLVLDWLSRDPGTGAILLDIRRIKDARAFLSAARAAARLRPTVAIRAGGLLADPSGEADATLEAALRRCGVLCVFRLEDLLAAAETLTRSRPARSEAMAIVTNAIGPAMLAADAALRDGLRLAELTEPTREAIRLAVPAAFAPTVERLDFPPRTGDIVYVGLDQPMKLAETALLLAEAREVGGVLVVHVPSGATDAAAIAAIQAAAKSITVPLLVCAMGETTGSPRRRQLAEAGVPVFAAPEQAVRGFLHLVQDRRNRAAARELPPSAVLRLAPDHAEVRRAFRRARAAGRLTLMQDEAMAVLAAYGVPTVPCRPATGADEAAEAARLLGFPVVLKRRRVERPDPAARGGVALDLNDADQVRAAARLLAGREAGADHPGFLVQRQVGRARELRLRLGEDPLFGPIIGFGQGGTAAQLLRDVAIDLPPLNLPLAHALIARTRVAATLGALHDQPAAAVDAVADTLVRISQLAVDFPEIGEMDVNPLFADAEGVLVADAWLRLRGEDAPPGRLAISPYPAELIGAFDAGGETLTIRPIRPEDAAAHAAFFQRWSPEDVRYRFFTVLRELSAEQVARMTQVDYEREIAFIAVRESTGETVGVSRLVREMNSAVGEFAVVVQSDLKGRGLASHLMQRLIAWGRARGITEIVGQVLADNHPMLNFVRHLGFTLRRLPDEDGLMEAKLELTPPPEAEAPP